MANKIFLLGIFSLGILLGSASLSSAQTNVSGAISQNTTWNLAGSPYIVVGDVTVNGGITLTIQPGVEVKFAGNYSLTVNGALVAQGTSSQRIKFTSNQTTPARGDWNGIVINSSGNTLDYLQVEYADNGILFQSGTVEDIDNSLIINNNVGVFIVDFRTGMVRNSTIQNNGVGIRTGLGTGTKNILNNTITNNTDGVYVGCLSFHGCTLTLNNNSIHSNTNLNLNITGTGFWVIINAENNWWGSQNVNVVTAGINDALDNSILPTADIFPYLDAPGGNPMGYNYLYGAIDGTISLNYSPYYVLGNMVITAYGNTANVIIQPGVELRFTGNYSLTVDGTLNAAGTAVQRIKFTSNQMTPARGDWNGIVINSSGNILNYLQVEYADTGISFGYGLQGVDQSIIQNNNIGIAVGSGNPIVQNNVIQNNGQGIYSNVGASPSVFNNTIINNTDGIRVSCTYLGGCFPVINNNSIHSNSGYNMNVTGFGNRWIINAENNWWGSTNPVAISATIQDYTDNPALPFVDFIPFKNYQGETMFPIGNVSVTQQFFSPIAPETTQINYDLPIAADVTIKIRDFFTNQVVRTLILNQSRVPGPHSEMWDGKDDQNITLSGGIYNFGIEAVDSVTPSRGVHAPPPYFSPRNPITNGVLSPANFDPYKGEVTTIFYNFPAPSIVTVKAGIPYNHVVEASRDLIVSQARESLGNTEIWDGRDNNGNIVDPTTYVVYGWAYVLPANAIVVQNNNPDIDYITTNPYTFYPVFGEVATIKYRVSQDGLVRILIKDPSSSLVKTLMNFTQQTAGEYTVAWDGKDSQGNIVSGTGHYKVEVTVTDPASVTSRTRTGNITVFK